MKFSKLIGFPILMLLFFSCNNNTSLIKETNVRNDTTEVIRLLIDSTFYRYNLPGINRLTKNSPFRDTIILCKGVYKGDTTILKYFSQSKNGIKFKLLTYSEICSLATSLETDTTLFPYFLEVRSFENVDTAYEVYIQSTCVIPRFDKYGHRRLAGSEASKCIFGMLCGGGISMIFTKQGDTLKAKLDGRWSD